MKHLLVLYFHNFPEPLFRSVLSHITHEMCDGLIAVYDPWEAVEGAVEAVWAHPCLARLWNNPPVYKHMKNRMDWVAQQIDADNGLNPQSVTWIAQDEILPPPEVWVRERDTMLTSDCDYLRAHEIHTWGDEDTIALPRQCRPYGPHMKALKWRKGYRWHPWRGHLIPANATKAYMSPYPLRHMKFQTSKLRRVFHLLRPRDWLHVVCRKDMPTLPFNPNLTFKEWLACRE